MNQDTQPPSRHADYSREATALRLHLKAKGVILIVLEGERGTGLSFQVPPDEFPMGPSLLRGMADRMQRELEKPKLERTKPNGAGPAPSNTGPAAPVTGSGS